ncbi:MAG: ABC transporter substrate-binding protein [Chloroflexota bacterium]
MQWSGRYPTFLVLLLLLALLASCTPQSTAPAGSPAAGAPGVTSPTATAGAAPRTAAPFVAPTIDTKAVKFCHLPFLDHSQAIIGVNKGWFQEVGITIQPAPNGVSILPAQRAAAHTTGQCDVSSGATGAAISLHKQLPGLVMFVVGDIFQGDAILAHPDSDYKRYSEFVAEGLAPAEAVRQTMAQIKGKTWAIALAPASQFSSNLFIREGGLQPADFTAILVDDAKTVELAVAKQADFQMGGAPARVELEGRGFYPIITIADLAARATPSADSVIQRALYPDGWMIDRAVWQRDPDLVLRMASVMWRITDLIVNNPDEALAIHVPFLNSISGRAITAEEGMRIYKDLDPFYTFEDNAKLYVDKENPLYWEWELGSKIKAQEESGVFQPGEVKPADVTIGPEVYSRMVTLETEAADLITRAGAALNATQQRGVDVTSARAALDKATALQDGYDFLDAKRFAEAVLNWATSAGQ